MSEAGDGLGQRLSSRIKSSPCQVKRDVRKRTINERKIECNTEHFIAPTIRHLAEVTLLLCPTSRSVIRKWIVAGEAATDSSWGKLWLSRSRIHSAHQCCHHRSPGNLIIRELRKRKRYIALASSVVESSLPGLVLLWYAILNNETGVSGNPMTTRDTSGQWRQSFKLYGCS